MTLKINYLDQKKGLIKSKAYFVNSSFKISEFQGEFDKEIHHKINNFLKKNKNLKDNKILCLNDDFEYKLLIIILADQVVRCLMQKMAAEVAYWQSKVLWHKNLHSFHFCVAKSLMCSHLLVLFFATAAMRQVDQL